MPFIFLDTLSDLNKFCDAPLCDNNPARHAPVAQLDRASDFESAGRRFDSCQARMYDLP
jgi:hypothetical protein